MIRVTRLNHVPFVLNSDLIEYVEVTPDTVISLVNGQKIMVLETAQQVIQHVVEYRRSIFKGLIECPGRKPVSEAEEG